VFRLTPLKNGGYCLETTVLQESITDHTGTTTFLYLKPDDVERLHNEIYPELFAIDELRK